MGAATVRSFLPVQAKPSKVLNHRSYEFWFGPAAVEIFVPKDKLATLASRTLLGDPKCAGMTNVQKARGRWGQAPAVWQVYCRIRMHFQNGSFGCAASHSDRPGSWNERSFCAL